MKRLLVAAAALFLAAPAWTKDRTGASLGIETITLAPGLEDVAGAPAGPGAWVTSPVTVNRPDDAAPDDPLWPPIIAGDLVTHLGSRQVWSAEDLAIQLSEMRPGETVSVTLVRGGSEVVVHVKLEKELRSIFLPARTCANMTGGTIFKENVGTQVLFGIQMTASGGAELAGQCPIPLDPCAQLRLVKQTRERTVVELNGRNFFIEGDWTKHTHTKHEDCREEMRALERMASERREQERGAEAERATLPQ